MVLILLETLIRFESISYWEQISTIGLSAQSETYFCYFWPQRTLYNLSRKKIMDWNELQLIKKYLIRKWTHRETLSEVLLQWLRKTCIKIRKINKTCLTYNALTNPKISSKIWPQKCWVTKGKELSSCRMWARLLEEKVVEGASKTGFLIS